jgi:hypothetical protein
MGGQGACWRPPAHDAPQEKEPGWGDVQADAPGADPTPRSRPRQSDPLQELKAMEAAWSREMEDPRRQERNPQSGDGE